jgi:hypothetical protein
MFALMGSCCADVTIGYPHALLRNHQHCGFATGDGWSDTRGESRGLSFA